MISSQITPISSPKNKNPKGFNTNIKPRVVHALKSAQSKPDKYIDIESNVPKRVQANIVSLLSDWPDGINELKLKKIYLAKFKLTLDLKSYGFYSVEEFVVSLPNIIRRVTAKNNQTKLFFAQLPENESERKFRLSADPKDMPLEMQQNIDTLIRDNLRVEVDEFQTIYKEKYGNIIDPLDYGFSEVRELLRSIPGKQFNINIEDGNAVLTPMEKTEITDDVHHDLFILHKHMKRSDFPPDVVSPFEFVQNLDFNNLMPLGKPVPVVITAVECHFGSITTSLHLLDYHEPLQQLEEKMKVYMDYEDDESMRLPEFAAVSGVFCAFVYGSHGYNRAQIMEKVKGEKLKRRLWLIDYGGDAFVECSRLLYLKSEFKDLEALAFAPELYSSESYNWTTDAVKKLKTHLYYGVEDDIQATRVCDDPPKVKLTVNGKDVISLMTSKNLLRKNYSSQGIENAGQVSQRGEEKEQTGNEVLQGDILSKSETASESGIPEVLKEEAFPPAKLEQQDKISESFPTAKPEEILDKCDTTPESRASEIVEKEFGPAANMEKLPSIPMSPNTMSPNTISQSDSQIENVNLMPHYLPHQTSPLPFHSSTSPLNDCSSPIVFDSNYAYNAYNAPCHQNFVAPPRQNYVSPPPGFPEIFVNRPVLSPTVWPLSPPQFPTFALPPTSALQAQPFYLPPFAQSAPLLHSMGHSVQVATHSPPHPTYPMSGSPEHFTIPHGLNINAPQFKPSVPPPRPPMSVSAPPWFPPVGFQTNMPPPPSPHPPSSTGPPFYHFSEGMQRASPFFRPPYMTTLRSSGVHAQPMLTAPAPYLTSIRDSEVHAQPPAPYLASPSSSEVLAPLPAPSPAPYLTSLRSSEVHVQPMVSPPAPNLASPGSSEELAQLPAPAPEPSLTSLKNSEVHAESGVAVPYLTSDAPLQASCTAADTEIIIVNDSEPESVSDSDHTSAFFSIDDSDETAADATHTNTYGLTSFVLFSNHFKVLQKNPKGKTKYVSQRDELISIPILHHEVKPEIESCSSLSPALSLSSLPDIDDQPMLNVPPPPPLTLPSH